MKAGAALAVLLVAAAAILVPRAAWAHAVGVSNGEYDVAGAVVHAKLTFARSELESAGLDAAAVARGVEVRGCTGALVDTAPTPNDGVQIRADYTCPSAPARVEVALPLLEQLSHGHRHVAHGGAVDDVLYRDHASFAFDVTAAAAAPPSPSSSALTACVRMGIEHILTGYDHLLFLFGLVLVGGRPRSLFAVVSSVTLAHSITLALAVLGVLAPSPRLVEPAIALSIAYVGVENFFVKDASKRWRLTFPFGLVHGFGFAGALREIQIPHAKLPAALVLFNVGVEAGQIAVLAALLPLVVWARKQPRFVQFASAGVAAMGVLWFVQRAT